MVLVMLRCLEIAPWAQVKLMRVDIQDIVDDRARHASLCENASQRNLWKLFAVVEMDDFTLSGFQKYCK
jgi:hypothetical protein